MLNNRPDFFIHCGDHIYADCPIERELKLPNGEIWRNVVTEKKSVVAHSLDEFRANYKYNWLDDNFRAFHADVPMLAQWDDHEVTNDWSPMGTSDETGYARTAARCWSRARAAPSTNSCRSAIFRRRMDASIARYRTARCSTCSCSTCAAIATPLLETGDARDACILGAKQLAWLKRELVASDATWKVIAADLPIGLFSEDAIALGDGPPDGASTSDRRSALLHQARGVRNIVWLTADMHYTAAHHYDPGRAVFPGFRAVLGIRLRARCSGTWAPGRLDNTFGPKVTYQKAATARISRPASGCSSSAASISTARPAS